MFPGLAGCTRNTCSVDRRIFVVKVGSARSLTGPEEPKPEVRSKLPPSILGRSSSSSSGINSSSSSCACTKCRTPSSTEPHTLTTDAHRPSVIDSDVLKSILPALNECQTGGRGPFAVGGWVGLAPAYNYGTATPARSAWNVSALTSKRSEEILNRPDIRVRQSRHFVDVARRPYGPIPFASITKSVESSERDQPTRGKRGATIAATAARAARAARPRHQLHTEGIRVSFPILHGVLLLLPEVEYLGKRQPAIAVYDSISRICKTPPRRLAVCEHVQLAQLKWQQKALSLSWQFPLQAPYVEVTKALR